MTSAAHMSRSTYTFVVLLPGPVLPTGMWPNAVSYILSAFCRVPGMLLKLHFHGFSAKFSLESVHSRALAGRGSTFIDFLLDSYEKPSILGSWLAGAAAAAAVAACVACVACTIYQTFLVVVIN